MVKLKLLQRLGYFPMLSDVPPAIIDHIRTALRVRALPWAAISRYDLSGTRTCHQKLLRTYLDIQPFDATQAPWLNELACGEARTKDELPDIVNVLIEELVRRRCELPPTLQRIATQARNDVNKTIYVAMTDALDDALIARIDVLLVVKAGKSGWEDLKREPKQPAAREIASFLKHINGFRALSEGLPALPAMLSVSKRTQLIPRHVHSTSWKSVRSSRGSGTRSRHSSFRLNCRRRSTMWPRFRQGDAQVRVLRQSPTAKIPASRGCAGRPGRAVPRRAADPPR